MARVEALNRRAGTRRWLFATVITALFAAVVITTSAYHEPWRDEVVPLSIVRSASSWAEVAAPLKFECHPILWYVVLREGWALVGRTWVLKAASVASAVGAIGLFMRSPLPWWLRCLFAFSFYPLYQYSVVSRGYGLEMFVLFAFCTLHPRRREHPLALALVLAALANTEALGLILAVAAAASLVFEAVWRGGDWRGWVRDRRLALAAGIYVAGLVLAVAVAFPNPGHHWNSVQELDLARIAVGVGQAIAQPAGYTGLFLLLFFLPAPSAWLWAYFVYLTRRPAVLCFAATAIIGMQAFFRLVYPPAPWHIGNLLLAVIAAMWLDASASTPTWTVSPGLARARSWLGRILAGGLTFLLAVNVFVTLTKVQADLVRDYSSTGRLAELLRSDPTLVDAVVIGEPDAPVTSLPYYADNAIYLPREGIFRLWTTFAPPRRAAYDLGSLLAAAREVRARRDRPVVIAMGWNIEETGLHTSYPGTRFEETFEIAPETRAEFQAATRRLASLRGTTITDEQYDVYVLR